MAGNKDSIYRNEVEGRDAASFWEILPWILTRRVPKAEGPSRIQPGRYPRFPCAPEDLRVYFVGHCTLILEMHGVHMITDPMFSDFASPIPGFGPRRFHPPGIRMDGLPRIDIVLITHNHYDHLDEPTIRLLGDGPLYVVPKGLAPWFRKRGIQHVQELEWWEETTVQGIRITATPCLHWSKRGMLDRCRSHWNGYAIASGELKFLFIGDSAYYDGFARIGERLGPFHVGALPIGAYDPPHIMHNVHMTPEEAVQAAIDAHVSVMIPTHYGCFPLTDEEVTEPPQRVHREWLHRGLEEDKLWLLAPGECRSLEDMLYIPTIRTPLPSMRTRREERAIVEPSSPNAHAEWSIAVCPYKGDMVDLLAVGERAPFFEGDRGEMLTLNHLRCSGFGDHPKCTSTQCPLRDPAFLRSHDLHGIRDMAGKIEPFIEMDVPPAPAWWKESLRIIRHEDTAE